MHLFRYAPATLFLLLLCSMASGQTTGGTFTAKKQKGKWGLVNAAGTPVTAFVYDSVTSKQFEVSRIDESNKATLKVIKYPLSFYYLWNNGRFDVFENSLLVSNITGFEPCSRYVDNRLYAFCTGKLWGWGKQGVNATEAVYDSVKFLETSQFLFDQDSYTKNGNVLDVTGYSYYAQYITARVQVFSNGCVKLVDPAFPKANAKEYCDAVGFIAIPEIFIVKKNGQGKLQYIPGYDIPSAGTYDSVASMYGMWMGFNNQTGKADLFIDAMKKTVSFAGIQDWVAARNQFSNEIALRKEENEKAASIAREQEAEKQKQLDIVKAKENEIQQKALLQKLKTDARKMVAGMKETKMILFNWNSNDSLLGIKSNSGKELLYPSAKKIELKSGNGFKTAVFSITRYGDIDVESVYNIKTRINPGTAVLTEELANKILYSIDTCTSVQRIPYLSLQADVRIYDPASKKYFVYAKTVSPDMNPEEFSIYETKCPVCNGKGFLTEGDGSVKVVQDKEKKLKKTGTTTITKKDYLANERVINGRLQAPTYTQSIDNYAYVDVVTNREVVNLKRVACYGCKGTKKGALRVTWDVLRQQYTCQAY